MKVDVQCPFVERVIKDMLKKVLNQLDADFVECLSFYGNQKRTDLTNWLTNHSTTMNMLKN